MKQIYNLIKKDFILIRNNILIMLLVLGFASIPVAKNTPGSLLYGVIIFMLTFMIYHMISMEEMKQKGHIYLATTPLSNKNIGIAKSFIITISFIIITIGYIGLSAINFTKLGRIGIEDVVLAFFTIEIFFAIYIPLTFKLGYIRLQMISTVTIFLTPIIISFILRRIDFIINIRNYILNIPLPALILFCVIILVLVSISTSKTSASILDSKEY
ncbi:ABC-2 transporter permease [Tissierella sp. MSJ-40]|uniref:ABC-2 transporter permease n=1 Tax=Tissierella simiarum TaxID=2841534 RepID=A0ABS6E638_9FIRM|nr:ABC-2 transporter permease [Tissierella simiarum]MBU5438391.1 ABC-2 transporter permease [Tissierella simiarum]